MGQLSHGTGQGLYDCLKKAMAYMGVTPIEWKSKMIGLGCDGASSNLGRKWLWSKREYSKRYSLDNCKLVPCTQIRIIN